MPIFEYNGKKYNVREEHIDSFMKDFPDASTIMEREGKKYRVKSADYKTFMSEQQQPEQTRNSCNLYSKRKAADGTGQNTLQCKYGANETPHGANVGRFQRTNGDHA